jgi:hypothetical protein
MLEWKQIRWFVLGFTVVFVGLAVFRKSGFYTGHVVYIVPLWQYYWLEIRRAASSGNVGPTSGAGAAALSIFFQHVIVALAGGAAIHFLAARLRRSRQRSSSSTGN